MPAMAVTPATEGWNRMTIALLIVVTALAIAALVAQYVNALFLSLLFAGLGAVIAITSDGGPGPLYAGAMGITTLLAAEFGFWSMEIPAGRKEDRAVILQRAGSVTILAGASLFLMLVTAVVADAPVDGGVLTAGIAAVAAIALMGLVLWFTRRMRT
jgi:hypothetical protein